MRWLLACLILAGPAVAQTPERLAAMEAAWREWAAQSGIAHSTLAIGYVGQPVRTAGKGWDADRPGVLASLSKAITGACAADLVSQGKLSFDTTLDGTDFTLAEMLTHTTGLAPDQTQGTMERWRDDPRPRHRRATDTALSRKAQEGKRGRYAYNNENYALAGALIDETVGPYAQVCADAVLTPAGATSARLSPAFGAYAAWGGWEMTGADMIRFLGHAYDPSADPFATPHVPLGDGMHYGLGTLFRAFREGHNYWHFGLLCFEDVSQGAFFASWEAEYSVTVFFESCADWPTLGALDTALVQAVYN